VFTSLQFGRSHRRCAARLPSACRTPIRSFCPDQPVVKGRIRVRRSVALPVAGGLGLGKRRLGEQTGPACRLISMKGNTKGSNSPQALAKGQVWKMKNAYIQIVELGKAHPLPHDEATGAITRKDADERNRHHGGLFEDQSARLVTASCSH